METFTFSGKQAYNMQTAEKWVALDYGKRVSTTGVMKAVLAEKSPAVEVYKGCHCRVLPLYRYRYIGPNGASRESVSAHTEVPTCCLYSLFYPQVNSPALNEVSV